MYGERTGSTRVGDRVLQGAGRRGARAPADCCRRAHLVLRRAPPRGISQTSCRRCGPLALKLASIRQRRRAAARPLKEVGDVSLSSPAFSPTRFSASCDVDYYVSIGGCAYTTLSRRETDTFSPVFANSPRISCATSTCSRKSANDPPGSNWISCAVRTLAEDGQRPERAAAGRAGVVPTPPQRHRVQ